MVNEIEVTLRGHVGHEPNLLVREGKQAFLRLNVASTPRVRNREGEWGDGTTQWFAVKLFGEFAGHVAQSVRKGDAVLVRGRLEHEEYQTRDGEQRWTAVIVADAFGPDLRTSTAHVSRSFRRVEADSTAGNTPAAESTTAGDVAADTGGEHQGARAGGAEEGGVDLSGFQVLPDDDAEVASEDEDTEADPEESMAERMSA